MELVTLKGVDFDYFENKILKKIKLSVFENEKILLIGANGAGKSTLLRVLCGFHLPKRYEKFNVLEMVFHRINLKVWHIWETNGKKYFFLWSISIYGRYKSWGYDESMAK